MSEDLWREVEAGLSARPRRLPPVLFYDAEGSALFEAITATDAYYPTRVESSILEAHADDILARAADGRELRVVELGAGSGAKTRALLRALVKRQGHAVYVPIDVSADAVLPAAKALEADVPGLVVTPKVGRNRAALRDLEREGGCPHLVLFIGSSIGNHEPADAARFLRDVREATSPLDPLLLGADMVKDPAVLERAYDDEEGVTARFNRNVLARLNREAGADFDLEAWRHVARYDGGKRRVEMHLESLRPQRVRVPTLGLDLVFDAGETIHTENSYKYAMDDVRRLAEEAGWRIDRTWSDAQGWFTLHLLRREEA